MTPSRVFWWYHNNCRCSAVMALFPYIAGDTYWLSRPPKCRCRPLYRISGGAVNSGFKNSWRYGPWYRDHDCFAIFMGFGMISFPFFSVDSFLFLLFFGTLSSPTGDFSLCPCSFLSFWCGLSHISELSHRGVRQNGKSNNKFIFRTAIGVIAHIGVIAPLCDKNSS